MRSGYPSRFFFCVSIPAVPGMLPELYDFYELPRPVNLVEATRPEGVDQSSPLPPAANQTWSYGVEVNMLYTSRVRRDSSGNPTGTYTVALGTLGGAISMEPFRDFPLGISGRYVMQKYDGEVGHGFAGDFGILPVQRSPCRRGGGEPGSQGEVPEAGRIHAHWVPRRSGNQSL